MADIITGGRSEPSTRKSRQQRRRVSLRNRPPSAPSQGDAFYSPPQQPNASSQVAVGGSAKCIASGGAACKASFPRGFKGSAPERTVRFNPVVEILDSPRRHQRLLSPPSTPPAAPLPCSCRRRSPTPPLRRQRPLHSHRPLHGSRPPRLDSPPPQSRRRSPLPPSSPPPPRKMNSAAGKQRVRREDLRMPIMPPPPSKRLSWRALVGRTAIRQVRVNRCKKSAEKLQVLPPANLQQAPERRRPRRCRRLSFARLKAAAATHTSAAADRAACPSDKTSTGANANCKEVKTGVRDGAGDTTVSSTMAVGVGVNAKTLHDAARSRRVNEGSSASKISWDPYTFLPPSSAFREIEASEGVNLLSHFSSNPDAISPKHSKTPSAITGCSALLPGSPLENGRMATPFTQTNNVPKLWARHPPSSTLTVVSSDHQITTSQHPLQPQKDNQELRSLQSSSTTTVPRVELCVLRSGDGKAEIVSAASAANFVGHGSRLADDEELDNWGPQVTKFVSSQMANMVARSEDELEAVLAGKFDTINNHQGKGNEITKRESRVLIVSEIPVTAMETRNSDVWQQNSGLDEPRAIEACTSKNCHHHKQLMLASPSSLKNHGGHDDASQVTTYKNKEKKKEKGMKLFRRKKSIENNFWRDENTSELEKSRQELSMSALSQTLRSGRWTLVEATIRGPGTVGYVPGTLPQLTVVFRAKAASNWSSICLPSTRSKSRTVLPLTQVLPPPSPRPQKFRTHGRLHSASFTNGLAPSHSAPANDRNHFGLRGGKANANASPRATRSGGSGVGGRRRERRRHSHPTNHLEVGLRQARERSKIKSAGSLVSTLSTASAVTSAKKKGFRPSTLPPASPPPKKSAVRRAH